MPLTQSFQICVLAVMGRMRVGKTTFLDLLARFLAHREQRHESDDWMWLNPKTACKRCPASLAHFEWRNGIEGHTQGLSKLLIDLLNSFISHQHFYLLTLNLKPKIPLLNTKFPRNGSLVTTVHLWGQGHFSVGCSRGFRRRVLTEMGCTNYLLNTSLFFKNCK